MNLVHRWMCSSARWNDVVEQHIVPWTLDGVDLGARALEIGPGYGAATKLLSPRVEQLTCVEIDPKLASGLQKKIEGGNVTIVREDATHTSLPAASFDSAVCFTMLHHVPSAALQDQMLREVFRLLRAGGIFAGVDSLSSRSFRMMHFFSPPVVVDPATFPERLRAAGFEQAEVEVNPFAFRFRARKPALA